MGYEPLYHALQIVKAYTWFFEVFIFLIWFSFLYFGIVFNKAIMGYSRKNTHTQMDDNHFWAPPPPPPDWINQTARDSLLPGFPSSKTPPPPHPFPNFPDFQGQGSPSARISKLKDPPFPPSFPLFYFQGLHWKRQAIVKMLHFIQKIPVYYNLFSKLEEYNCKFCRSNCNISKSDYLNDRA